MNEERNITIQFTLANLNCSWFINPTEDP